MQEKNNDAPQAERTNLTANGKQAGAVYRWEVEMCEYNGKAAAIFHYLYLVDKGHREKGREAVMRFTENQIINQVFMGMCSRMTARKSVRWLESKNFIAVAKHDTTVKLKNRYPDRASFITINHAAVEQWRSRVTGKGAETAPAEPQQTLQNGAVPLDKISQWQPDQNRVPEMHTQQVQNSHSSGDFPLANFSPLTVDTVKEDPLYLHDTIEPEDQDSPSRTMGTRFSDSSRRGTRHLTWNIGLDPVPEDAKLQQFSRTRWCMALAGMFQIRHITQPEARKVTRHVSKLSVLQMLWAQVVYLPRRMEPWLGSWDDLLARLDEAKKPLCAAHPDTELDDVKEEVNSWLNRNSGPENLQAIFDAVAEARVTPMTDDEEMHVFAATWREYLRLRKDHANAACAWRDEQIEFMVIRPKYKLT